MVLNSWVINFTSKSAKANFVENGRGMTIIIW